MAKASVYASAAGLKLGVHPLHGRERTPFQFMLRARRFLRLRGRRSR